MIDIQNIKNFLKEYNGNEIRIMEVCGSHTAAISKYGIESLLSNSIKLISGPGCPVCVTPSQYIDKLIALSLKENTCVVTFGDLMRVPGSEKTLSLAKGEGGHIKMVYSPMDVIRFAEKEPNITFIFAAIGFETTTPVYALLIEELIKKDIKNVKILSALKTMPEAIEYLCKSGAKIDGFLAPGHVSVITGSKAFVNCAEKYSIPFAVSGFTASEILVAIYNIVKNAGKPEVINCYPRAVSFEGNKKAQDICKKYFLKVDAVWRGMGMIEQSGLQLKNEFLKYDAGSSDLIKDKKINEACRCGEVLTGKINPHMCPLFGKICTPSMPQGACMVSNEGSCAQYYINKR